MTTGPILILGGSSEIGLAIAHRFAAVGHPVQLAGRNLEAIEPVASDIALRHAVPVSVHRFDALNTQSHEAFIDGLPELPEVAVSALGLLSDSATCERDTARAIEVMRSNFEGPAAILGTLANRFEARGSGTLVGIGSVAGERGRATNYIYGSAKAGFAAYLSGLRNRLAKTGVHVITVKLGYVDTRMIAGMNTPKALTAQPEEVGRALYKAWRRGRTVIYVRPVWRLIMAAIRALPEAVFMRLRL